MTIKDAFDAITGKLRDEPIPCPPCKPPKQPIERCPSCDYKLILQGRRKVCNRCGYSVYDPTKQPDALARLEAWLAVDKRRYVKNLAQSITTEGQWAVTLVSGDRRFASIEPGLAATIHAAIDKAEECKL